MVAARTHEDEPNLRAALLAALPNHVLAAPHQFTPDGSRESRWEELPRKARREIERLEQAWERDSKRAHERNEFEVLVRRGERYFRDFDAVIERHHLAIDTVETLAQRAEDEWRQALAALIWFREQPGRESWQAGSGWSARAMATIRAARTAGEAESKFAPVYCLEGYLDGMLRSLALSRDSDGDPEAAIIRLRDIIACFGDCLSVLDRAREQGLELAAPVGELYADVSRTIRKLRTALVTAEAARPPTTPIDPDELAAKQHEFWDGVPLEELARRQGITAPQKWDDILGAGRDLWDSDEDFERFLRHTQGEAAA